MDEVTFVVRVSARPLEWEAGWPEDVSKEWIAERYAQLLRDDLRAMLRARVEVSALTVQTVGVIVGKEY